MPHSRRQFLAAGAVGSLTAAAEHLYARTPAPAAPVGLKPPFRLSQDWYSACVRRLQAKLQERKLDGIIVNDDNNNVYLTGMFARTTERPVWLFVPAKGDPVLFHPGLDRDLVAAWWIKDAEWYFDFPHHGEFNQLVWKAGPRTDLQEWMLKGLARRGFGASRIALDREPPASALKKMEGTLPEAKFVPLADFILSMRQVKTPEEIELTQKSVDLHDAMHAFARNYILQHGSSVTDYEVGEAADHFGTEMLFKVLQVDGKPHTGVGVRLGLSCRTGVATAYPHPNQFFHARIKRGDALQLSGGNRIGGYGGEGYRAFQIAPINDLQKKMWEVHTEMTLLQAELCKAGTPCGEVCEKVLALPKKAGLEKYVYHRPAHGSGMEGHQAPYLSFGDETKLVEGMMFSNEPGLYNPEGGFGYNHSNCVLVQREKGAIMNKTPLTKEFCWLRL